MTATPTRPPHYLTDSEFARLRLTDEQCEEMAQKIDLSVMERAYFRRTYDPVREAQRSLSQRQEKVVFVLLCILAGGFVTILSIGAAASLLEDSAVANQFHNPITYMVAAVIAAWFMARD